MEKPIIEDAGEYIFLALQIALNAHRNQKDRGGHPYINHPLSIAAKTSTPEQYIVALLHDVVEDSDITIQDLIRYGFPQLIVDAAEALTKAPDEEYFSYIERVKKNSLAVSVKLIDLTENMDLTRLNREPTQKDYARCEKYRNAAKTLST